jgi:hypothetical protein
MSTEISKSRQENVYQAKPACMWKSLEDREILALGELHTVECSCCLRGCQIKTEMGTVGRGQISKGPVARTSLKSGGAMRDFEQRGDDTKTVCV